MENWIWFVIILIVGFLILNNVNITFEKHEIETECNHNQDYVLNKHSNTFNYDVFGSEDVNFCWVKCHDEFKMSCVNNKVLCECRTSILNYFFSR